MISRLLDILCVVCLASGICGAATVYVTPANTTPILSSALGDTINFAAGTYTLATNPTGAAATWPTGRHYIGNGAVLALSGGIAPDDNQELLALSGSAAVTEFTGFVCTCAQIHCENGVYNIHDNTFRNGHRGIFVAGVHDSHFDRNAFSQLNAEGVFGYPANNNTADANTYDNVVEPVHFSAQCDTLDVSGNIITHATRIGIELQKGITHLTVNNNWMSDWLPNISNNTDSHMGISCATGGYQSAGQWVGFGEHITISGNAIIQNGPDANLDQWAKSAIEIMGDLDVNITNNFAWGWGNGILNGANGAGCNSSNNVWICGAAYGQDAGPWPIVAVHGTGDKLYSQADPNAPAIPQKPTQAQSNPSTAPSSQPTAAPATRPTLAIGAAQDGKGDVILAWPAQTGDVTIEAFATSLTSVAMKPVGVVHGPSAGATVGPVFNGWDVSFVLLINGVTYEKDVAQVRGGPGGANANAANFAPAILQPSTQPTTAPATQPTTAPTVVRTITITEFSDGTFQAK